MNPSIRYPLVYGLVSGATIILLMVASWALRVNFSHSLVFGYLIMLAVLTFIFVGLKRYRDVECGGVIRFWRALGIAMLTAVIAAIAYALVWELYLAVSGSAFMDDYAASMIRAKQASGASAAEVARVTAEMNTLKAQYANPLFRIPMTAMEMLPVGAIVAVLSAALLCFPRVLPARDRATAPVSPA